MLGLKLNHVSERGPRCNPARRFEDSSNKWLKLNTEYSLVNTTPADDVRAPKIAIASLHHSVGCIGQTACIALPELIPSTWVKPNPKCYSKCGYIFYNL